MSVSDVVGTCVVLPKPLLYFGWFIPPTFVVCAGLMAKIINIRVSQIGEYLTKLESSLQAPTVWVGRSTEVAPLV